MSFRVVLRRILLTVDDKVSIDEVGDLAKGLLLQVLHRKFENEQLFQW